MKKKITLLTFLILILFSSFVFSEDIKVGLEYNKDIDFVKIESYDNMYFGVYSLDKPLMKLENNLIISKDTNYHIILTEENFNNYDLAIEKINSLNFNSSIFPYFDGSWKIFIGNFNSKNEAINFASSNNLDNYNLIEPSKNRLLVKNPNDEMIFSYIDNESLYFWTDTIIQINGNNYRGAAGFRRIDGSDITIINRLDIEKYLYSVVPREMPTEWPSEALKAQAVVARNYAYCSLRNFENYGFDVTDDTQSQVYGGYEDETNEAKNAVDETKDIVAIHDNDMIIGYYHSNSGGFTANVENVWTNPVPYLKATKDPYSLNTPKTNWNKTFTKSEIENKLKKFGYDIGSFEGMKIIEKSASGRVTNLKIYGTKKDINLLNEEPRKIFGYTELRSMKFDIVNESQYLMVNSEKYFSNNLSTMKIITSRGVRTLENFRSYNIYNGNEYTNFELKNNDYVSLKGYGYGHGIGLSQWGAMNMAKNGFTYEDILKFYYKDIYLDRRE